MNPTHPVAKVELQKYFYANLVKRKCGNIMQFLFRESWENRLKDNWGNRNFSIT